MKKQFILQAIQYCDSLPLAEELWQEIEAAYAARERHYHTLSHLQHLLKELAPLQSQINDWQTLFFAVCYHDVVYDVVQSSILNDNEERSAAFAERHLTLLHFPTERIEKCRLQILATKNHLPSKDNDANFFTDADIAILGQSWQVYEQYKEDVRQEYYFYPDSIYNAGRTKVLKNFLQAKQLYKTPHFFQRYEAQARKNIERELSYLLVA